MLHNNREAYAAKKYYNEVKQQLSCPRKIKKKLLFYIRLSMDEFLEKNPNADFDMIVERFGEPFELANSYIESLDTTEVKKALQRSKWIKTCIITLCVVILLLFVITFIKMIHDNQNTQVVFLGETVLDKGKSLQ